jgi:hypothetical protein
MHKLDTGAPCVFYLARLDRLTVDEDFARLRLYKTGSDPRERRFACAILTDDSVDKTCLECDADTGQSHEIAIGDGNVAAVQRR